jgi:uncharacterized protein
VDEYYDGGEPVCWLEQVCPECGRMREDRSLDECAYCGTPVGDHSPAPASDTRAPGSGA